VELTNLGHLLERGVLARDYSGGVSNLLLFLVSWMDMMTSCFAVQQLIIWVKSEAM